MTSGCVLMNITGRSPDEHIPGSSLLKLVESLLERDLGN